MTFVTLECVRARVWLSPSLRSVGACVWPWLPERVVVVHMYVGKDERVGPSARGAVRIAAAARPTRAGPRARVSLAIGSCPSEGWTGDVPSQVVPSENEGT